jgi:thiamine-phosphate pyrophosphorylase
VLVVTSRRRLTAQCKLPAEAWQAPLLAQVAGALAGGADLVQVREPDLDAGPLAAFLRRLFREVPGSASRVVVNDRLDVALATGAAGVHLTDRSVGLEDIQPLIPADKGFVTGRSVHDPATAARCRAASYQLAGAVLASASKPAGWRLLGWSGLADVVRAAGTTPVVAIGGMTAEHVPAARRAGATGVAGIGCFLPSAGEDIASSVQARVRAVRQAFEATGA